MMVIIIFIKVLFFSDTISCIFLQSLIVVSSPNDIKHPLSIPLLVHFKLPLWINYTRGGHNMMKLLNLGVQVNNLGLLVGAKATIRNVEVASITFIELRLVVILAGWWLQFHWDHEGRMSYNF